MSAPSGTAVVTGASSGIGWAFARALAYDGRRVVIIARRRERLEALANELRGRGASPEIVVADLAEQWRDVAAHVRAIEDVGTLINAAGFGTSAPFAEADLEKQLAMVRLHVLAAMALSRAVLPAMIARRAGEQRPARTGRATIAPVVSGARGEGCC